MSDADAAVGPLRETVAVALDEDLGVLGDLTSQAIVPEARIVIGHGVATFGVCVGACNVALNGTETTASSSITPSTRQS